MALWSGLNPIWTDSRIAGEDITAYHAVKLSADDTVVNTDTQGEKAFGIALESVDSGDSVKVMIVGDCPVIVATASGISRGSNLTPSVAGSADEGKVEVAASGDYVLGYALTAPSADDDQIMARINCSKYEAATA